MDNEEMPQTLGESIWAAVFIAVALLAAFVFVSILHYVFFAA